MLHSFHVSQWYAYRALHCKRVGCKDEAKRLASLARKG